MKKEKKKEKRKRKERKWGVRGERKIFFFLVLHISAFFKNVDIGHPLKKIIWLDL